MIRDSKDEEGVSGDEKPALIVLPPLSTMSVLEGGTGPEDFVLRLAGAIVARIDRDLVLHKAGMEEKWQSAT